MIAPGGKLTQAQRSAAIDRAGESLALLSGAGCGKTLVLAMRYMELLRRCDDPRAAVSRLVALTFTEKAALEMSRRVRDMVAQAARTAEGQQRHKWLSWLDELPEARISTIHGYCASLLRAHAVEAGIDPDFAICADELLVGRLIGEAAEEALLNAVESQRTDAAELLTDMAFEGIVELVGSLVEGRASHDPACQPATAAVPGGDAAAGPAAGAEADALLARWRTRAEDQCRQALLRLRGDPEIARNLNELAAVPCSDPADKLAVFRQEQLAAIGAILTDPTGPTGPTGPTPAMFAALEPTAGNAGSAKSWGSKAIVMDVRAHLRDLREDVRKYAIYAQRLNEADAKAARSVAAMSRLAVEALAIYDAAKRRTGLLDFTDLLIHAGRLIRQDKAVREFLARQIDQLLIDECQDTDGFQIDLLTRLVGWDSRPAGPARPPRGRLFVVGDAKQSIYRFRGAQVEEFQALCGRLGPGRQEQLDTSFRTHAAGVAFVNHLFAPLMGEAYAPIQAHRQVAPAEASVEIILAGGDERRPIDSADAAVAAQAAVTAERIHRMIANQEQIVWDHQTERWRAVRPGDIAILFARMTTSLDYERELQRREVPYYVVAGTGFFQQQEVFDVLNALEAVDDPHNDIALLGALRSSLFGVSDNALARIARAMRPPYFVGLCRGLPPDLLPPDQHHAVAFGVELLGRLHRGKDAIGPDALLERILDETGYEATLLSQFQGRRLVGNVRRVVDLARTAASEGLHLAEFLAQMRQLIVDESRYEQAAVAGEEEDVVRLMTIHKAKGLEFPVVVVPDLNVGRRPGRGPLLVRGDWGPTLKCSVVGPDGEEITPLSYELAKRLEDDDERAEDIRKLYVAATRHEDRLIFVGADWRDRNGSLRQPGGYLAMMDEVLGISAALEAGRGEIAYADGRHVASVRRATVGEPARPGRKTRGQRLMDHAGGGLELASAVEGLAGNVPAPALLGPLPAAAGQVEVAVTALADYEHCPMLYRWRQELRVPSSQEWAGQPQGEAREGGDLDAATLGTFYHRCMELVDFAGPQAPSGLARQVAEEMELAAACDLFSQKALSADLAAMLDRFRQHGLWRAIAAARQAFRELAFIMRCGPAILRGQIDLLYEDAAGVWHIVDYKSDRVARDEVRDHAGRYDLQMLVYAAAAARHLGRPPQDATLYFLRPGESHVQPVTAGRLAGVEGRCGRLAESLILSRRTGRFDRLDAAGCAACLLKPLCGASPTAI